MNLPSAIIHPQTLLFDCTVGIVPKCWLPPTDRGNPVISTGVTNRGAAITSADHTIHIQSITASFTLTAVSVLSSPPMHANLVRQQGSDVNILSLAALFWSENDSSSNFLCSNPCFSSDNEIGLVPYFACAGTAQTRFLIPRPEALETEGVCTALACHVIAPRYKLYRDVASRAMLPTLQFCEFQKFFISSVLDTLVCFARYGRVIKSLANNTNGGATSMTLHVCRFRLVHKVEIGEHSAARTV